MKLVLWNNIYDEKEHTGKNKIWRRKKRLIKLKCFILHCKYKNQGNIIRIFALSQNANLDRSSLMLIIKDLNLTKKDFSEIQILNTSHKPQN